jgi:hypothetical protein
MTPRAAILKLLAERGDGKTICPSEAARLLAPQDWRPLIAETRKAGTELADEGLIEVTQGGQPVSPRDVAGPIRYRLKAQP